MTSNMINPISFEQINKIMDLTLDILEAIEVKDDNDNIIARAGWTIELVLNHGDTLQMRKRAWKAMDFFIETFGAKKLVYWYGGYPKFLVSKTAQEEIEQKKENSFKNPGMYNMIFNLASGKPEPPELWADNAQDFRMYCWLRDSLGIWTTDLSEPGRGPNMSFIRMHIHTPWIKKQPPCRSAVWFTSRMVELMQPFWCSAGWGLMSSVEETNINSQTHGQQLLYPILQRMPGLNAIDFRCLIGTTFNNSMHSVNWLNYISDPLLHQLGGRETVRQQIKASKNLSEAEVGNCMCIRAGSIPALGDTEKNVVLPGYGEAARLLKPIRVKSYLNNFVAPPPYGNMDKRAWQLACDAYLSRFDLIGI